MLIKWVCRFYSVVKNIVVHFQFNLCEKKSIPTVPLPRAPSTFIKEKILNLFIQLPYTQLYSCAQVRNFGLSIWLASAIFKLKYFWESLPIKQENKYVIVLKSLRSLPSYKQYLPSYSYSPFTYISMKPYNNPMKQESPNLFYR